MHPTFSITSEDIRRLNDGQARELIARLCRAELRKKDISQAFVTWGGDQRAKDGGVDVRVDIDSARGISGYIKKNQSAFQVKAENFAPAKIPGEMAPKGVLRPAIVDLAKVNGAYIIVSTKDDLSDSSLSNRVKAMNACLVTHAVSGTVDVDFYDSRKIADWVEQHPPIVAWIKYTLGNPIVGWRPYTPWAYNEADIDAEYLIDDRVKIFVPNADQGSDVLTAINRLRSDLRKNVSVRLVGLSGVGKTRLVQALFDKRVSTEQPALDFENVLYTDISDDPTPQPYAMMEALQLSDADCVVVVDNCGPEVHQKLTTLAKRSGSKLRLITIEYDIRDDLPEGTICYRLEGSSDEVIKQLLKRRYKVLSGPDMDKIVSFSDGNARVAFALASTTETTGELARLRDSDLFKRLFNQKNSENEGLLICAEVASLLYSFNGVDITSNSEAETLARLVEVSTVVFSRNIAELKRRGLVQERGEWRAVLPHAIANRLAALAIEALPKDVLIEALVEKASDRVARSFSRRLGYLHELKPVREIVQEWLKQGGRFGDLAALNSTDRQIFANIAPVNQEAALDALERAAVNSGFAAVDSPDRAQFARISRSLAYETALFERAVSVLIRFALAEPEGHNHDSTRDMLKSLFYCYLSGTEALSDQRSTVVRRLLLSSDEAQQRLGTSLLNTALEAWHFSSHYDFDFGARKRGYGWAPRTKEDVRAWYLPFLEISVEVGKKNTSLGQSVRTLLGDAVRGLWVNARLQSEIVHAAKELLLVDGWPEGWLGIRRILQYDKKALGEDSLKQLLELEHALAPTDLKGKICAKVLARGTFSYDLDDDEGEDGTENAVSRYARAEKEAEDLGKAAALDSALLLDLLLDLLRPSTTNKLFHFGAGVGEEIQDFAKLEAQARHILACTEKGKANIFFVTVHAATYLIEIQTLKQKSDLRV